MAPLTGRERPPSGVRQDADARLHATRVAFAHRLSGRLLRAMAPLRKARTVQAAFFQRKPPGLRWRVETTDADAVRSAVAPVLDAHCAPGRGLASWTESLYESEVALFGGQRAMDVVHRLFDADTAAWSRLVALRRSGKLRQADALLALAQTNELFAAALPDVPEEVWDAWSQLAQFHALAVPRESGDCSRPSMTWLAEQTRGEAAHDSLAMLAQAQAGAGLALASLARDGQLSQGLRGILAAIALFGWNRIGLTAHDRRVVLLQALRAWHPYVAPERARMPLAA